MITIGSNGQKIAYGIKHYNLDTEADLVALQKRVEPMGSTCFVISTSKYYMLNSKLQWVEITPFGKVVSGSGDNDNPGGGDTPGEDESTIIIYEGGII
jgi:hypothetical protein